MLAELMTKWAMMPYDMVAWSMATMWRKPPKWNTPNRVVLSSPFALLRDFSVRTECDFGGMPMDHGEDVVPTLVFPPMAGHSSHVIDMEGQSQIQLLIKHGLINVYCFEWLSATQETKNVTIEDRMAFIDASVKKIAGLTGRINIVGNCQGGWEAAIWCALHPERVNTAVFAGSPIDTSVDIHPDLKPIMQMMRAFGPEGTKVMLDSMVAMEGGVHRGLAQISMFVMFHPISHQMEHIRLYNHIREPEKVDRFTRFYDWYFYPVDMSGAMFKWVLPHIFLNNELYNGTLEINGKRVDLHNITAPVFLLAGEEDDITPKRQQLNMANHLGSKEIHTAVAPGGHIGLFIGHKSQAEYWPPMLNRIYKLSTH